MREAIESEHREAIVKDYMEKHMEKHKCSMAAAKFHFSKDIKKEVDRRTNEVNMTPEQGTTNGKLIDLSLFGSFTELIKDL